jgi:hypothetical protein
LSFILDNAERIGAVLVFLGLVVSMFLGTPQSRVPSGSWSLGETDCGQLKMHNALTFVGPIISALGCLGYLIAAFN